MKKNIKNTIEALLFASDIPLTAEKLKEILEVDSVKDIRNGIKTLNQFYIEAGSAITIIEVAGGYQIVSREEYAESVQKLYKGRQASRLTQRGLETLAIIAYKQPITKHEIEDIRGVNVDGVVKTLLERNLITIEGRQKSPGNPLLYGTTKYFLEYFGINNLDALPKLKEIDELLKEDEKFLESLDQVALRKLEPEALGITNIEEAAPEKLEQQETGQQEESKNEVKNGDDSDKTQ
jgi:segregation and condensation protein B